MGLAAHCLMFGKTRVIRFPVDRTGAERERQAQADVEKRVAALPETIRELDVAWIFKEAASRNSKTRART